MERDGAFWRTGTEGLALLLSAMFSTGLLASIVALRFDRGFFLSLLSGWYLGHGRHFQLAIASSFLLRLLARQVRHRKRPTKPKVHTNTSKECSEEFERMTQ